MKVLVVEDDADLAQALASALREQSMVVDIACSLREATELAFDGGHDILVVDRGLPDGDGLRLIEHLRAAARYTPALVLTAMGEVAERVRSLDSGADDYLSKPFSSDELLARLRALARRPAVRAQQFSSAGRLRFDHELRQAEVAGEALNLPRRELLVLEALLLSRGRTVQRQRLVERVYGEADDIQSNSLEAHVSRLRAKLEQRRAGVEIHAIRGVGYLLRVAPGAAA
ncbi:response regulator transcription factor [Xenophilus arseniciresistens]|uniref:Response regulator transcription factor n=1 Tax=Xenophilus arseniciresistens TaxID=1283306 RepID=A0AAE3N8Q7_9BURK|nr:response regulator transcription factor [Xenophilus arseniciresistens]MDA7416411.1 response regulator transcription factor [Xenophilus arseniciresistens]